MREERDHRWLLGYTGGVLGVLGFMVGGLAWLQLAESRSDTKALYREMDRLTTRRIAERLDELESRSAAIEKSLSNLGGEASRLDTQMESLRQVINPEGAEEILTVARLRQEILARKAFETGVRGELEEQEKRLDERYGDIHGELREMRLFIWGVSGTFIGSLLAVTIFSVKHVRHSLPGWLKDLARTQPPTKGADDDV